MSTSTLSERLRAMHKCCYQAGERHSLPNETSHFLQVDIIADIEDCIAQAEALEAREPVAECEAMCGDHGGIEGCSCSECSTPLGPRELCAYCNGCGRRVKWPMADGTEYRTPIAPLDRSRMVEALPSWIEGAKQLARQLRLDDGDTPWIGDMIRALDASKK